MEKEKKVIGRPKTKGNCNSPEELRARIVYLADKRYTQAEIAGQCDVSPGHVASVLHAHWRDIVIFLAGRDTLSTLSELDKARKHAMRRKYILVDKGGYVLTAAGKKWIA